MFKKVGTRNSVTLILVAVLMAAGIMNWRYNGTKSGDNAKILGEAAYVNSNVKIKDDENAKDKSFDSLRIEKETARDKAQDTLKEIVDNEKSSENAVADAQEKLARIAFHSEQEASLETLLKSKKIGEDVLITVSDNGVSVTVKCDKITPTEITVISDTVKEQTGFTSDKIKISTSR